MRCSNVKVSKSTLCNPPADTLVEAVYSTM